MNETSHAATEEIEVWLEELYDAFCFDAAQPADWQAMESMFAKGATFVSPIRDGAPARLMGTETFLAEFKQWVATSEEGRSGFHERILHSRIEVFANVAHASVVFEGFVPGEAEARTLGLDSLQLVRDGGEWKLVSFATQYASDGTPMPQHFLQ